MPNQTNASTVVARLPPHTYTHSDAHAHVERTPDLRRRDRILLK